jgi:hypothetical protein
VQGVLCSLLSFTHACLTFGLPPGSVRLNKDSGSDSKQFMFDSYLPPSVSQREVYERVAEEIVKVWYGVPPPTTSPRTAHHRV